MTDADLPSEKRSDWSERLDWLERIWPLNGWPPNVRAPDTRTVDLVRNCTLEEGLALIRESRRAREQDVYQVSVCMLKSELGRAETALGKALVEAETLRKQRDAANEDVVRLTDELRDFRRQESQEFDRYLN